MRCPRSVALREMTAAPASAPPAGPRVPASRAVRLPAAGDGSRARRRRRRERRRAAVRVVLLFALALSVPLVVVPALDGEAAPRPAVDAGGEAPGTSAADPPVLPVLAAVAGADGRIGGLAVLLPAREGGGAVLLVPAGAMVEVPSFGLQRIGDAAQLGGVELLQASAENLLGVPLGGLDVLDATALAGLVRPAGALRIEVPERIEAVGDDGRVRVLFERGVTEVPAERVHELLTARGDETDLGRLVRHQAFWEAWLDAIRSGVPAPTGAAAAGVAAAVRLLATGPVELHLTPVEPVAAGAADGADLYRVLSAELTTLMGRLAPGLNEPGAAGRLRVQLLNGTGEPGLAQVVTPRLVPAGAEVKLVGNADRFDYATTQIVYYDQRVRAGALAVRDALGVGEVVRSRQRLEVVELTVVVGHDFLDTVVATDTADQEGRT